MKSNSLAKEIQEIINQLCSAANLQVPNQPVHGYQLPTKKMGYRIFSSKNSNVAEAENEARILGRQVADISWTDNDGKRAFALLSSDVNGELFELDIWKTNYSALTTLRLN